MTPDTTSPSTGYRITTPDGWVIEAKDELAHRRVLTALASLADVLARAAELPTGTVLPTPTRVPANPSGFDKPLGREPVPQPSPFRRMAPLEGPALQKLWDDVFGKPGEDQDGPAG
ncbi:hypothetical protein ABIE56_000342 [Luteibacter sp. 621]|uniref:hypothetical protein n=1 Tax=Luteibacter sp. 621 TaxID=3373916 RepID=UPI003D24986A